MIVFLSGGHYSEDVSSFTSLAALITTMAPSSDASHFATTQWSVVLHAGREDDAAQTALALLCQRYWYPLYSYARRRTGDRVRAQDLTQEFFVRLLEKGTLEAASPQRGRFRSFLLTAMRNFISHEREKQQALKRGGAACQISLDFDAGETRFRLEPSHDLTAERLFDRQWSLQLLELVQTRLRNEYASQGKQQQADLLSGFLAGVPREGYASVAAALSMTEEATRQAVSRMRKRFRELLREEVAQTVAKPAEIEDEIRGLLSSLEA